MSLKDYGWSPFFAESFEPFARQGLIAGRVVVDRGRLLRLRTEAGEITAETGGRLCHLEEDSPERLPAIGDWVAARAPDPPSVGTAVIDAVLPRRSQLSRKVAGQRTREQVVAANVDVVFLVMGLDGDFSPLTSHHALERELRHLELRQDQHALRAERKKTAAIHKAAKRFKPRRF